MKSKGMSLKKTVKPKYSRRMHTRTATDILSYHINDVFHQSSVDLWDTLSIQYNVNHGIILSRPTWKDTVGSTGWRETKHI